MVRAKFKVYSVTDYGDQGKVVLEPVTHGSKENDEFYKWTPNGMIELNTVSKSAAEYFQAGKEYYVDFTITE
jgi:hypothetical protein